MTLAGNDARLAGMVVLEPRSEQLERYLQKLGRTTAGALADESVAVFPSSVALALLTPGGEEALKALAWSRAEPRQRMKT